MNRLDKNYKELLQDIIDNGVKKADRTGTGTISVFGRQIRHDMKEGFPLLTTKKMEWKSIVTELIWFLRGDTNIKFLVDNGCNIWNGDAYKRYDTTLDKPIKWLFSQAGKEPCPVDGPFWRDYTKEEFINRIKTDGEFAEEWGDLGPIYGAQWRGWNNTVDQVANLIDDIKRNPDSRRLMVNAWNVSKIDDMVLPPCHYGFQCYTRELTDEELYERFPELREIAKIKYEFIKNQSYENAAYYRDKEKSLLEELPKRAISLMWNQRSVDTFLGLPFNIASYGLLLELIAKEVNMIPDQLIGNLGDTHLYSNHIEQAKEQIGYKYSLKERFNYWFENNKPNRDVVEYYDKLSVIGRELFLDDRNIPNYSREPYPLPSITIRYKKENAFDIGDYDFDDITLENYKSHKPIKAPLSN